MTKANAKRKGEIVRIGAIAAQCGDSSLTHVIVPNHWRGLRVFAILKEDYDRIRQQEESEKTKAISLLASALVEGSRNKNGRR